MVISFTIVKGKCTPKTQTGLHQARTRFEQFLFFCNKTIRTRLAARAIRGRFSGNCEWCMMIDYYWIHEVCRTISPYAIYALLELTRIDFVQDGIDLIRIYFENWNYWIEIIHVVGMKWFSYIQKPFWTSDISFSSFNRFVIYQFYRNRFSAVHALEWRRRRKLKRHANAGLQSIGVHYQKSRGLIEFSLSSNR